MKNLKNIFLLSFFFFGFCGVNITQAQSPVKKSFEKTESPVDFSAEDIEKIRTLIEQQLKTRVSPAEFNLFGKPSLENLELFKKINETQKDDPFFSQPHMTFIIESMEERLGVSKPKSKFSEEKISKVKSKKGTRRSNLPKHKSDLN